MAIAKKTADTREWAKEMAKISFLKKPATRESQHFHENSVKERLEQVLNMSFVRVGSGLVKLHLTFTTHPS